MAVTLQQNSINFGTNTLNDSDIPGIKSGADIGAIKFLESPVNRRVYFGSSYTQYNYYNPNNNYAFWQSAQRYGNMFVTRMEYRSQASTDEYGNYVSGYVYAGNVSAANWLQAADKVEYSNPSSRSIKVRIVAETVNPIGILDVRLYPYSNYTYAPAGRGTDDGDWHTLYRGGTPSDPKTHSGGTALTTNHLGGVCYYDTIPANTTYTYWHYANIGGSNADNVASNFTVSFVQFL